MRHLATNLSVAAGATALGAAILLLFSSIQAGRTVQLGDGTVAFVQPPRLLNAITTFSVANSSAATYYFTIALPDNAGEPLQRLTLTQESGSESIAFRPDQSEAFEGARSRPGSRIDITVLPALRTQSVSVIFKPPIAPGKTFTIGLRPVRNPGVKGTYLFGVTAFPAGETVRGQFLGYGRFQVRRRGGV